jgi:hypothetical protein
VTEVYSSAYRFDVLISQLDLRRGESLIDTMDSVEDTKARGSSQPDESMAALKNHRSAWPTQIWRAVPFSRVLRVCVSECGPYSEVSRRGGASVGMGAIAKVQAKLVIKGAESVRLSQAQAFGVPDGDARGGGSGLKSVWDYGRRAVHCCDSHLHCARLRVLGNRRGTTAKGESWLSPICGSYGGRTRTGRPICPWGTTP